jgi:hypothetical protein
VLAQAQSRAGAAPFSSVVPLSGEKK